MPFAPNDYKVLLDRLCHHYDYVGPAVPPFTYEPACLLRHDVDLMLTPAITRLADIEEAAGVTSAWFIRVDGHYNVLSAESRGVLERLRSAGHKIGLHYNCATVTPFELERGFRVLNMALGAINGAAANAITGHRPTLSGRDPYRRDWRNPGSIVGHGYVADSRREPIVLPDPLPRVLQCNTHPEHWVTDLPLAEHYEALREELAVSLPVAA